MNSTAESGCALAAECFLGYVIGGIVFLIDGHSAVSSMGRAFSVKDIDALRGKALEAAVGAARRNAEGVAKTSGRTLGRLQQIEYGWTDGSMRDHACARARKVGPVVSEYDADTDPDDVYAEDSVTLISEISERR